MQQHICSGSLVCKALLKVNNWQVSILHICKTRDEANRIEIEEIRNFNSVAPNGYNLTHGGEGAGLENKNAQGYKHSDEAKRKMSVAAHKNWIKRKMITSLKRKFLEGLEYD